MSIENLAKEYPSLKVEVTASDLFTAIKSVVSEVIGNHEKKEEKEETYLTTKKVCELLGITHSTAWRWQKDYLKPVRIGKKVRYKQSDVERILGKAV